MVKKRNLIITLDFGNMPEWTVKAKNHQIAAWLDANKGQLPFDNLIILPSVGESKLYWLEGKIDNPVDFIVIKEIRDKLKPVLEIGLGVRVDTTGYINPHTLALEQLRAHRAKLNAGK